MNYDDAMKLAASEFWVGMSYVDRARFQIMEDRLCMPFDVFHEAVEKALGRPVFTHEFGLNRDGIIKELFDGAAPPSAEDILNLIPSDKRVVLIIDKGD